MDKSKDVKEWLKRAKSSLILSKSQKVHGLYNEELCFGAQQAAEKALKGLILHLGLTPHKTHSFIVLLEELEKRIVVPEHIEDVIDLNPYAVIARYPDDYIEITDKEYLKAVEIAEDVYNWVVENIK